MVPFFGNLKGICRICNRWILLKKTWNISVKISEEKIQYVSGGGGISAILGKVGPRLKDFSSRTFRCLLAHSCHIGSCGDDGDDDHDDDLDWDKDGADDYDEDDEHDSYVVDGDLICLLAHNCHIGA